MRNLSTFLLAAVPMLVLSSAPANDPVATGFMQNKGQVVDQHYRPNGDVLYLYAGAEYRVQLRAAGFSYDLVRPVALPDAAPADFANPLDAPPQDMQFHRIDVELLGASLFSSVLEDEPLAHHLNYYTVGSPEGGATDVRSFSRIVYQDVYPYIDLEFLIQPTGGFKYNFHIKPGGNVNDIRLRISGADELRLAPEGIVMGTRFGPMTETVPSSYWQQGSTCGTAHATWRDQGNGVFGFELSGLGVPAGATIVVDPVPTLSWHTYFGGSAPDGGHVLTCFGGACYAGGRTDSPDQIATAGAFQGTYGGQEDGFLMSMTSTGQLIWATYLGGQLNDRVYDICVADSAFLGYMVGQTDTELDAGAGVGALNPPHPSHDNGFMGQFDLNTGQIFNSEYFAKRIMSIACLPNQHASVAGVAYSGVGTVGTFQPTIWGTGDAPFVAEFYQGFLGPIWSSYCEGYSQNNFVAEDLVDHVVDAEGCAYLLTHTDGPNLATPGAVQETPNGVMVMKFSPTGQRVWGSYVGGPIPAWCPTPTAIALQDDQLILASMLECDGVATTPGAWQSQFVGIENPFPVLTNTEQFLACLDTTGSTLRWCTYFGGNGYEGAWDIEPAGTDHFFVVGSSSSYTAFNTPGSLNTTDFTGTPLYRARTYISKFSRYGQLQWSTLYHTDPTSVSGCLDLQYGPGDTLWALGGGSPGPGTPGTHQPVPNANGDVWLAVFIDCNDTIGTIGPIVGDTVVCSNGVPFQCAVDSVPNSDLYEWQLPPGATIISGDSTSAILVDMGNTPGSIRVRARNPCVATPWSTIMINVDSVPEPLQITPGGNILLCDGDSVTLVAAGLSQMTWNNGSVASQQVVDTAASFWVTGVDSLGCAYASDTVDVFLVPLPYTAIVGPDTVQEGSTVNFAEVQNSGIYQWTVAGGTIQGSANNGAVDVLFPQLGQALLMVEKDTPLGCVGVDSLNITVVASSGIGINEQEVDQMRLSPVPASDELVVSGVPWKTGATVVVLDGRGATVKELMMMVTGERLVLNVSDLAQGCYALRIQSGQRLHLGRFAVQR